MGTMSATWVKHPGYYIREELEARGWAQRDLAFILGCADQSLNMILSGKRGVSPEMAKALGDAFDVPAEFFLNLQKSYELSRAEEPAPGVAKRARLQNVYPVREMIKREWIEESDATLIEVQLCRFFDVEDSDQIPYLAHAARKSSSYEERDVPPDQVAWLFRVKQIASQISVPRYRESALRDALSELESFRIEPEETRHVSRVLMQCGVRFVVVEKLPGSTIDGVCFWLNDKAPVIGMTLRRDYIDNFWFVLRHEIEHVLRGDGQKEEVIDAGLEGERAGTSDAVPEQERRANQAAAEFCVPQDRLKSFIARKRPYYYERDVVALARVLQVHPGLVVGQMQHHLGRYDYLKKHQKKVRALVTQGAIVDGWGQVPPVAV